MSNKTKKALMVMIAVLIVLIILIIILAATDSKELTDEQMGDTIIAEAVEAIANGEDTPDTAADVIQPAKPEVVDLPNEKEVRLYVGSDGVMNVISEFNSSWTPDADIAIFEAINSKEDTIYYDDYFSLHQSYWDSVVSPVTYKIGYELSFDLNGEHKVYTILSPADIENNPDLFMGDAVNDDVYGHMGVWVYYDMHQSGTYFHLTSADMTDETLMTSIKLRPTPLSNEISNLKLTAFSYSSNEEIGADGHYIGTHGYKIAVNNQ